MSSFAMHQWRSIEAVLRGAVDGISAVELSRLARVPLTNLRALMSRAVKEKRAVNVGGPRSGVYVLAEVCETVQPVQPVQREDYRSFRNGTWTGWKSELARPEGNNAYLLPSVMNGKRIAPIGPRSMASQPARVV